MSGDHGLALLLWAVVVLSVVDVIATSFLGRLWWESRTPPEPDVPGARWRSRWLDRWLGGGSWLLLLLSCTSAIVSLSYIWFAFLAISRLTGHSDVSWSPPISAAVLLVLGSVPLVKAIVFIMHKGDD